MPTMSRIEQTLCRSRPWNAFARRIVPAALGGEAIRGDVLEIGGGSGAMAESLVRHHPACWLTVTDFDPAMVAAAQKRLAPFRHVSAQMADATQLPFNDHSFDAVLSFLMLHHVVDWEAAVTEASRVLRPGGTLVGYDLLDTKAASWFHRMDGSPHRLIGRGEFERASERAGLEVVSLRYGWRQHILSFAVRKPS